MSLHFDFHVDPLKMDKIYEDAVETSNLKAISTDAIKHSPTEVTTKGVSEGYNGVETMDLSLDSSSNNSSQIDNQVSDVANPSSNNIPNSESENMQYMHSDNKNTISFEGSNIKIEPKEEISVNNVIGESNQSDINKAGYQRESNISQSNGSYGYTSQNENNSMNFEINENSDKINQSIDSNTNTEIPSILNGIETDFSTKNNKVEPTLETMSVSSMQEIHNSLSNMNKLLDSANLIQKEYDEIWNGMMRIPEFQNAVYKDTNLLKTIYLELVNSGKAKRSYQEFESEVNNYIQSNTKFQNYEEFYQFYKDLPNQQAGIKAAIYKLTQMEKEQPYLNLIHDQAYQNYVPKKEILNINYQVYAPSKKIAIYDKSMNPISFLMQARENGALYSNLPYYQEIEE